MKFSFVLFVFVFIFSSCAGCSHSSRRHLEAARQNSLEQSSNRKTRAARSENSKGRFVVPLKKEGGVYHMPIKINGVEMSFIFDTGASMISISQAEVLFLLKQGKLSEDDFRGETFFGDATGSVSEGDVVNLKSVQIGPKILQDVEASVVRNLSAPLLLGQSALSRFGKVSIDYKKSVLIFE